MGVAWEWGGVPGQASQRCPGSQSLDNYSLGNYISRYG